MIGAASGDELTAEQKAAQMAERKAKRDHAKQERAESAKRASSVASGGLHFGPTTQEAGNGKSDAAKQTRKEAKKPAQKKVSKKNDPRLVAMARELRDRWQEHVVPGSEFAGMIEDQQRGKYDVAGLIGRCDGDDPATGGLEIVSEVIDEPKRLDAASGQWAWLGGWPKCFL